MIHKGQESSKLHGSLFLGVSRVYKFQLNAVAHSGIGQRQNHFADLLSALLRVSSLSRDIYQKKTTTTKILIFRGAAEIGTILKLTFSFPLGMVIVCLNLYAFILYRKCNFDPILSGISYL